MIAATASALIIATIIFAMIWGNWFLRLSWGTKLAVAIIYVAIFLALTIVERTVML